MNDDIARSQKSSETTAGAVGIIGVGIMGLAMARNLLKAGIAVLGFDPSETRRDALTAAGGSAVSSLKNLIEGSEIVILSLPSANALADTVFALAQIDIRDRVLLECSTLSLETKLAAHAALEGRGHIFLDCPISGTGAQAVSADLVMLASGERSGFDRCAPVFAVISKEQHFLGAFGNGTKMKLIANHLVTIHNASTAEAMVLGLKVGLEPAVVYNALRESAGSSRMFQVRGPLMRDSTFGQATVTVKTHVKDLGLISQLGLEADCPLPLFAAASQFYLAALAQGHELEDTASIYEVMKRAAGI
ncbi:NAD(P)-dependent oxidoreductase [Bradyrhizobium sp. 187]|uniref:NAD(P)-dependent oxidoreductase n=1 Tax=Bradyrhizobium sp. 187 TaxID=2782655 RepID=UPI001FFE9BC8|nr:NAD(P)-dependent oxidoreductase [Bradyrhizobium sp. 187]UPJ71866.1 NAD(P)-dependent oxidoreductase [Bradyrhizobium sp. 187]